MKFEYCGSQNERQPVALIDQEGDLMFRCKDGTIVWFDNQTGQVTNSCAEFQDYISCAQKLFYKGDKIIITL